MENKLNMQIFQIFVQRYRDRFGEHKLGDESLKMWYAALCDIKDDQFEDVTTKLIGKRDRAFGFQMVVDMVRLTYPKDQSEEWRGTEPEKLTYSSGEVRSKMLKKMAELLGGSTGSRRKGHDQSPKWREEYADFLIDLVGSKQAVEIAKSASESFHWFEGVVRLRIAGFNKKL